MRPGGRAPDELRRVRFTRSFTRTRKARCSEFGDTRVLCTASVEKGVPPFLRGNGKGWITAEYGMLPRATHTRSAREARAAAGRTHAGDPAADRPLAARGIDLGALGERTITIDCDVLQADGGTRTAAITGGLVALADACEALVERGCSRATRCTGRSPRSRSASSTARRCSTSSTPRTRAEVDMNVVMNEGGAFIEVQGTAEGHAFRREELDAMLNLAAGGTRGSRPAARGAAGLKRAWRCPRRVRDPQPRQAGELRALLAPLGSRSCRRRARIGAAVEDGDTFAGNALLKARQAAHARRPRRRSPTTAASRSTRSAARPACTGALRGPEADDAANNALLLAELAGVSRRARTARFRCAMAFAIRRRSRGRSSPEAAGRADRPATPRHRRLRLRPAVHRRGRVRSRRRSSPTRRRIA